VGKPSYDDATLAAYFQPLSPATYEDPIAGPLLRELEAQDPDLVLAVADVDRSQIRDALARSPSERLSACFKRAAGFERARVGAR
jgi:hypothetical protein